MENHDITFPNIVGVDNLLGTMRLKVQFSLLLFVSIFLGITTYSFISVFREESSWMGYFTAIYLIAIYLPVYTQLIKSMNSKRKINKWEVLLVICFSLFVLIISHVLIGFYDTFRA